MKSDREMRIKPFKGAKIYQVFIDRFAGCLGPEEYSIDNLRHNFIYGNLTALMNEIQYIKSMGFNVIWLTPFYVNQPNGYHGYHVTNYNHVDPRFAFGNDQFNVGERANVGNPLDDNDVNVETEADLVLKKFVQKCHDCGIKVMMDFVPNHCHEQHVFFREARENRSHRDWFYFNGEDYMQFLHIGELPKLNLGNPEVRNHLIKSTKKFLSYGIDAVRIDHCIGPSRNDLNLIIQEIHREYPMVPFIGEILLFGAQDAPETLLGMDNNNDDIQIFREETLEAIDHFDNIFQDYYDILDGVLDFNFLYNVDKFVSGLFSEEECVRRINEHYGRFKDKKDFLLLKFVDSHDCNRIMLRCHNNVHIQQRALKILYTNHSDRNEPLVVYYGTEDLMTQDDTISRDGYGDYRCRQPMRFIYKNHRSFF